MSKEVKEVKEPRESWAILRAQNPYARNSNGGVHWGWAANDGTLDDVQSPAEFKRRCIAMATGLAKRKFVDYFPAEASDVKIYYDVEKFKHDFHKKTGSYPNLNR
jgi:hypothetical protein